MIIISLLSFVGLLSFVSAQLGTQGPMTIIAEWNLALNEAAIRSNGNIRVIGSRHIQALMHTAMYNAWTAYDSKAVSAYGVKNLPKQPVSERTNCNKAEAVSYAAYGVLKEMLPTLIGSFFQVMLRHEYPTDIINNPNPNSPAGIGITAARRVIKARWNDRSNWRGDLNPSGVPYSEPILLKGYKPYRYINTVDKLRDINYWQPLRNPDGTPQIYDGPHQGIVTPFALESGDQFRPGPPKRTYNDPKGFYAQCKQIYDISLALTERQRFIAEFWQGSGRFTSNFFAWFNITRDVSQRFHNTLDDDVKMFFLVANALEDSMISCYDTKRHYNSVRPITCIRKFFDPDWDTVFLTPPFPEYTAGHPTTSAAAGDVLRRFLGSDYYGASYTDPETDMTLSWRTFTEMWKEIGVSRMYGGVHFEKGVKVGEQQGLKVAEVVFEKYMRLVNGECDD